MIRALLDLLTSRLPAALDARIAARCDLGTVDDD